MSRHGLGLPRAGGAWVLDPSREGLKHRGGNAWDQVAAPHRLHFCVAQSAIAQAMRTSHGRHVAGFTWCACGAITCPGLDGRWVGKNIRRDRLGTQFPAWYRDLVDLARPDALFARPHVNQGVSDVVGVSEWRGKGFTVKDVA